MDSDIKDKKISQILSIYEDIPSKLGNEDDVDVIYLDFSKTFEKVDQNILLHKSKAFNITRKILIWLETFLKKRQQRFKVNSHLSNWVLVLSSVPQRPVLGPLLFLIMMTEIDRNTQNANLGSFADDTKIGQIQRYTKYNSYIICPSV